MRRGQHPRSFDLHSSWRWSRGLVCRKNKCLLCGAKTSPEKVCKTKKNENHFQGIKLQPSRRGPLGQRNNFIVGVFSSASTMAGIHKHARFKRAFPLSGGRATARIGGASSIVLYQWHTSWFQFRETYRANSLCYAIPL